MKQTNSILGNWIYKGIAVLICCISGSLIFISGYYWVFLNECGATTGTKAYEMSKQAEDQIANYGTSLITMVNDDQIQALDVYYGPDSTNLDYRISIRNEGETNFKVLYTSEDFQANNIQTSSYYTVEKDWVSSTPWDTGTEETYRLEGTIANPIRVQDEFSQQISMFNHSIGFLNGYPIVIAASCFAMCFALVYLVIACGHRKNSETLETTWLDRIPFEFVFGAVCVWFYLCCLGMAGILQVDHFQSTVFNLGIGAMTMLLTLMILASLAVLACILTFVVRVKTHSFWKSTIVGIVWIWFFHRLSMISVVPKFACALGAIELLRIYLLSNHEDALFVLSEFVVLAFLIYWFGESKLICDAGKRMSNGQIDQPIPLNRLTGVARSHAKDLNSIQDGMSKAVDQAMQAERLKTELITNVSHDIKTPLTSVINYVDLLNKEHTPEQETEYLEVLQRQCQKLKKLTEDVVEASKASSGAIQAKKEPINIKELLDQSLAEYKERFDAGNLEVICDVKTEPLIAEADGRLLWRTLSNLLSNISKYSLSGTRVYIQGSLEEDQLVHITLRNISREPLNVSADELMERFVRGDSSRHTEGSGLGLNIAESLMKLNGGSLNLTVDGDLFKVDLALNPATSTPVPNVDSSSTTSEPTNSTSEPKAED